MDTHNIPDLCPKLGKHIRHCDRPDDRGDNIDTDSKGESCDCQPRDTLWAKLTLFAQSDSADLRSDKEAIRLIRNADKHEEKDQAGDHPIDIGRRWVSLSPDGGNYDHEDDLRGWPS